MLNETERRVCERVRALEAELIAILSGFIAINTVDPPGENYDDCARYLSRYLDKLNARVRIEQVPLKELPRHPKTGKPLSRPNVVGEVAGSSHGKVLHFNGHYDVVPAVGEWTMQPFRPRVRKGKLYGRGSTDMKAGTVSAMVACRALQLEEVQLGGTMSFSFVPDEENDLMAGTKYLVEQKKVGADFCIVCEPTGSRDLFNGHKGCLWLEIVTHGKATHGSAPWRGINAFEKMVKVVNEVNRKIKPALLHEEDTEVNKELVSKTGTITLGGTVASGKSPNVVPPRCTLTIDRRLAPRERINEVLGGFTEIMQTLKKRDPKFSGDIKILSQYEPCVTPVESELVQVVMGAIEEVTGEVPDTSIMIGGCDMRYFHAAGIPSVIYGPGNTEMAHQADEYIEVEQLIMATQVYALTAMRLLGVHKLG